MESLLRNFVRADDQQYTETFRKQFLDKVKKANRYISRPFFVKFVSFQIFSNVSNSVVPPSECLSLLKLCLEWMTTAETNMLKNVGKEQFR